MRESRFIQESQFKVVDARKAKVLDFSELLQYIDLLFILVKRDFISLYKQTVLGPLWYVIQPVLMTITFSVIFGAVAGIATDDIPRMPFYLAGLVLWNFFSEILLKVADTFNANQRIFSKVYFPRIIVPLSITVSTSLKLGIQLVLFLVVYLWYYLKDGNQMVLNATVLLVPLLVLFAALLALGLGLLVTSLTAKYRDLRFLLQFGVQLLMYTTPIVYPLSSAQGTLKFLILANPMTGLIECFKYAFFGVGSFQIDMLVYPVIFTVCLLYISLLVFSKYDKNFVDTI